ncbi:hypothetical protein MTR_4g118580 [Medicago truncatula]|uniref:Uncharacterized protein n=1 Tax=Medicago truncatula TaxID=3880 RepID=G7JJ07_MEDTR|nr:hypothetical protein MTR_4g118580 [Medicago truncatula]
MDVAGEVDREEIRLQATKVTSPPQKSNLISCDPLDHISDIKLIRTDTTLDLSQKAEKATVMTSPPQKSNLISCDPLSHISDIKLIRTDTTLDLSQKAEKAALFVKQTMRMIDMCSLAAKRRKMFGERLTSDRSNDMAMMLWCLWPRRNDKVWDDELRPINIAVQLAREALFQSS